MERATGYSQNSPKVNDYKGFGLCIICQIQQVLGAYQMFKLTFNQMAWVEHLNVKMSVPLREPDTFMPMYNLHFLKTKSQVISGNVMAA